MIDSRQNAAVCNHNFVEKVLLKWEFITSSKAKVETGFVAEVVCFFEEFYKFWTVEIQRLLSPFLWMSFEPMPLKNYASNQGIQLTT